MWLSFVNLFCVCFCSLIVFIFFILSLLCPFLATMYFAGYFAGFFLALFFCLLSLFFSPTVFCDHGYFVTTVKFVADKLMLDKQKTNIN